MKKCVLLVTLLVLCLALVACDPARYSFKKEDFDQVKSIELINYDNPDQKDFISWVPDHTADLKPFDKTKMSHLEVLDEDKITNFIDDLCISHVLEKYFDYDSPNGKCIKVNYKNGDFLIIWSNYQEDSFGGYIGNFSSNGEVSDFIGCFAGLVYYEQLVNNYFQTQI